MVSTSVVSILATPSSAFAETQDQVVAAGELPMALRSYTKLAPLGAATSAKDRDTLKDKTLNLSLQQLASRLEIDLVSGHTGQGGYFVSGDLDESIFRSDCAFVDPTNRVDSLSQYRKALQILFDPQESYVQLVQPMAINKKERTLTATIRSRGVLQLPWRPYITSYESTIVYRVDDNGLLAEQSQVWSKSAGKALQESFTPSFNRPAPKSNLAQTERESMAVTQLFGMVNGRRPYEYTDSERSEIAQLIDQVVTDETNPKKNNDFHPEYLPGKWMLVYIQPGPTGVGIDRRTPFADFGFNDNFQVFGTNSNNKDIALADTVQNIGQILGPWAQVQVSGRLREEIPGDRGVPKRFVANIDNGALCVQKQQSCLDLPIAGEGLFDSMYLGRSLRIGQNINGGGARVVQVKLSSKL